MKKITRMLPVLAVLLASMNLLSCTEEELVGPAQPGEKNTHLSAGNLLTSKQYLLFKQNNVTLEYDASRNLTKVTYSPGNYVTYETGVEESDPMDEQFLRKNNMTYSGGVLVKKIIMPLSDGEFQQSFTYNFDPNTGAVIASVNYGYEFNSQGKLIKRYLINNPMNRIEFIYNIAVEGNDTPGDLVKVMEYTSTGKLKQSTEFMYSAKAPADKYGFYPEINDIDPFDRCMGIFSRKLPTSMKIDYATPLMADVHLYYEYQLDANGYPVNRKTYKYSFFKKELVATTTYKYL